MEPLHNGSKPFPCRRPELPAFCHTRRRTILVPICGLSGLRILLLVLLLVQLSTLLLVLAAMPLPTITQPLPAGGPAESISQP